MKTIQDLFALRVFVYTVSECYQVLGIIHSKYKPMPNRFKDYIAMPKTNMYQSLHTTVFGIEGYPFEIQIRTYEMDEVAEQGIAAHWAYKEKAGSKANLQSEMEQKLNFFRNILELNSEEANDAKFVQSVTEDVLKDSVYVFTPNGDVIELPIGSTPIDFAYRVHSEIGDKMVGALVNNAIVPLDYVLKDYDIVKIHTNKNSLGPSREWIHIAHTTQARNKIKAFYNRIDKEGYLKKGEELLNKELRKRKIATATFLTNENIQKILSEFKLSDITELYIGLGNNQYSANSIFHIIQNENDTKEQIILKKAQNKDVELPVVKNDILVAGIDRVKINIASCCKPVPGDRIVGYITKGYGITIHRMVCPNMNDADERMIDVAWNEVTVKKYPTSIRISSTKNILLDIIAKATNTNIMVESVNTVKSHNEELYDITVFVEDKERLVKFMGDIDMLPDVLSVERVIR